MVSLKIDFQSIKDRIMGIRSTQDQIKDQPRKLNKNINREEIGNPSPIIRNDFSHLYSNSSSFPQANSTDSSIPEIPNYESVTAEILKGYLSSSEEDVHEAAAPHASSTGGIKRLGTPRQATGEQDAKTRPRFDVSNLDSRLAKREVGQPTFAPIKRLGRFLEASTARRRTPVPNVSELELQKYESQHVKHEVKNRRDSVKLSYARRPLNIQNSDGSSNQFDRTAKNRLPQKLFKSAVTRQGFDPSNPKDVERLGVTRANEKAPFTRAERELRASEKLPQAENRYDKRDRRTGTAFDIT